MTITLRQESQTGATTKGSTLTFAELDNNVIDLLTNKIQAIQVEGDSGANTVGVAQGTGILEIKGGTNITTAITADSAGLATLTITGTTFLADIVSDTSPQLGGNLDMNGQQIVTTSNGNIKLYPNGTGVVEIGGDGSSADGTIQLNCSQNSHGIKLASPPHSAGQSYTLTFPSTAPGANKLLQTDANGDLSFIDTPSAGISDVVSDTTPQLGGNLDVNGQDIVSTSNGSIDIQPNGNGKTNLKNITFNENIHDIGTTSGTKTPDVNDGPVQTITLDGNLTLNALASPTAGQSLTLIITQDGTGGRTLSSTMKFAGGTKTLSTAASAVDIMTVFYDGSNYWASLSTNFS